MNVILIGMKHCGKSTIGAALAARWQCAFYDVDRLMEATYECGAERRLDVREILLELGEDEFRRIEGQVVCELYLRLSRPEATAVVALGGRTVLNESVCDLLSSIGLVVYLEMTPETLFERVARVGLPPFLNSSDPAGHFRSLFEERAPRYRQLANIVVNVDGLSVQEAVERIAKLTEEHAHGRK